MADYIDRLLNYIDGERKVLQNHLGVTDEKDLVKEGNNIFRITENNGNTVEQAYYLVGDEKDKAKILREIMEKKINYMLVNYGYYKTISYLNNTFKSDSDRATYGISLSEYIEAKGSIPFSYNTKDKWEREQDKLFRSFSEDLLAKELNTFIGQKPENDLFPDKRAEKVYIMNQTGEINGDLPDSVSIRYGDAKELFDFIANYSTEPYVKDTTKDRYLEPDYSTNNNIEKAINNTFLCHQSADFCNLLLDDDFSNDYISELFRNDMLTVNFDSFFADHMEYYKDFDFANVELPTETLQSLNVDKAENKAKDDDKSYFIYKMDEKDIEALEYYKYWDKSVVQNFGISGVFLFNEELSKNIITQKIQNECITDNIYIKSLEIIPYKDMTWLYQQELKDKVAWELEDNNKFYIYKIYFEGRTKVNPFEDKSVGQDLVFEGAFGYDNDKPEDEVRYWFLKTIGCNEAISYPHCDSIETLEQQYEDLQPEEPSYEDFER